MHGVRPRLPETGPELIVQIAVEIAAPRAGRINSECCVWNVRTLQDRANLYFVTIDAIFANNSSGSIGFGNSSHI